MENMTTEMEEKRIKMVMMILLIKFMMKMTKIRKTMMIIVKMQCKSHSGIVQDI